MVLNRRLEHHDRQGINNKCRKFYIFVLKKYTYRCSIYFVGRPWSRCKRPNL